MKYDAKTNCNEEISFLSTSLPYDSMKEDLEKFSYLNSKSVFYCILEGDLHEIDLEKKKDKILESGLVNESLTASKDQSIIAIEKHPTDSDMHISSTRSIPVFIHKSTISIFECLPLQWQCN